IWFALFLVFCKAFGVVVRGAHLSLGQVFLFHRLPQPNAFDTDCRNELTLCQNRPGGTFGCFRSAVLAEFQQFLFWYRAGEESLGYSVFSTHQLGGVDEIQGAVSAQTFGEQRVATRVQGGTQVSKW